MTRPEFGHPIKGPAYLMDPFVTPEYRLMEKVEKEQMYLEGREKQLLFEARKKQETLDGERRLIGEKVASLPPNFDREKALPLSETRESKLESKRLKSITPGDFEWNLRNSNARARAIPY
ncbi:hypothetical protein DIPPA_04432 [Diplonema papillatum]|nr:hypothetical protein DIPPA_04432 [Diplonema papillatum]